MIAFCHGAGAPMNDSSTYVSEVEIYLGRIEKVTADLAKLPHVCLGPNGTLIPDIDWYALAAIKKTASLSHAFCLLIRAKNTLAAAALIRLQLDTGLRIFGLSLIDDLDDAGAKLMNDETYRKLKCRNNVPLTDKYLHEELDKKYPGVTGAYVDASSYVHLSAEHIKAGLSSKQGLPTLFFHLNGTEDTSSDGELGGIADVFDQVTGLTAHLITEFFTSRFAERSPSWGPTIARTTTARTP